MSDFEFQFEKPAVRGRKSKQEPEVKVEAEVPVEVAEAEEKVKGDAKETPKYDKDELLRIFDEIIFSGEYVEDVVIKGKLRVQFRTRTSEEVEEISRIIDTTTYNLVSTLNEARMILNLQYGLTMYQGKSLVGMNKEDKAKFIKRIPGPVVGVLLDALYKFDDKVFEACKELEENF
jgi:hypothetical protein